jgi:hypothetical protein
MSHSLTRWLRRDREIEMVMIPATRVAGGVALGAQRVAFDVGGDGELGAAGAAQDGAVQISVESGTLEPTIADSKSGQV